MAKEKTSSISKDPDIENNKIVAAMSYIWILCLIPLLGKKNSAFAQFHAKQGFVLFVVDIVASLIFWFPFFGQLLMLALVIVSIMGAVKAYNGEKWEIPFIYEWSKKINL